MERQDTSVKANVILSALKEVESIEKQLNENPYLMQIQSIWDNGGKTADRYTVVLKDGDDGISLSDNPDSPNSITQWITGVRPGNHLGKKVNYRQLPLKVQRSVLAQLQFAFENKNIDNKIIQEQVVFDLKKYIQRVHSGNEEKALEAILGGYDSEAEVKNEIKLRSLHAKKDGEPIKDYFVTYDVVGVAITIQMLVDALKLMQKKYKDFYKKL